MKLTVQQCNKLRETSGTEFYLNSFEPSDRHNYTSTSSLTRKFIKFIQTDFSGHIQTCVTEDTRNLFLVQNKCLVYIADINGRVKALRFY